MDANVMQGGLIQQAAEISADVNLAVRPVLRRSVFPLKHYTSVASLLLVIYHLWSVGPAEAVSTDESGTSADFAASRTLARRAAIRRIHTALSNKIPRYPQACPLCNSLHPAHHRLYGDATTETASQLSTQGATTGAPSSNPSATAEAPLQIGSEKAEQPDRPTVEDVAQVPLANGRTDMDASCARPVHKVFLPRLTKGNEDIDRIRMIEKGGGRGGDTQSGPEWLFKADQKGGKRLRGLEKQFTKWLRSRFGKKYDPYTCKKLRREGRHPSAALRHSPIEQFGYPVFDERSGRTFLERRLPLSIVQGFLVPVRVGAEDYVIQGTYDQISAFLECFEEYKAVASTLQPDGHWSFDTEHGVLYLQVQNTTQDLDSPFSPSKILFRWGFDRIIRIVVGARSIKNINDLNAYDEFMDMIDNIENVADFLPHVTKEELFAFWEEVSALPTVTDRIKLLCAFLSSSFCRTRAKLGKGWNDDGALNLRRPLTLTLTSYPKPSHGVRATYAMESSVVTFGDIREAFSSLFERSPIAYALRATNKGDTDHKDTED